MKFLSSAFLISAILLVSCGDSKEKKENVALKAEIEKLKVENASLKSNDVKMKASINDFNKFLKEIEQNLASVDQNKTMIAKLGGEGKEKQNVKADIKTHIAKIKELMENSKLKIISLDKSLAALRRESGDKSAEILALDQQIKALTRNLLEKDEQIEQLDIDLVDIEALYQLELESSAELKSIINRAFYITATAKELKEKEIVNKEGGFIGLGKVKVLNANASDALFTKIKKDETEEIALNVKKVKLITNHPEGSYEIEEQDGKVSKLSILDAQSFWKDGNYLVLEVQK